MAKPKPNTSDKAAKGKSDRAKVAPPSARARVPETKAKATSERGRDKEKEPRKDEPKRERDDRAQRSDDRAQRNGKPTSGRIEKPKSDRIAKPEPARAEPKAEKAEKVEKAKSDRIAKSDSGRVAKPSTDRVAKAEPARAATAKPTTDRLAALTKTREVGKPDRSKGDRSERDKSDRSDRERSDRFGRNGGPDRGGRVDAKQFKCPFPGDELGKWRQLLLERRSEISHDIAGLVKDAMEAEDGHTTPNHIAERGSDADLQDMSLGMAGEEETILWQIDRALRKIDESSPLPFGLCEFTKEAIPRSRLQLLPWTPLSIEGATHMEQNRLVLEDMLLDD